MSTCEASGSGHQLLEELRGSRRTGDLMRDEIGQHVADVEGQVAPDIPPRRGDLTPGLKAHLQQRFDAVAAALQASHELPPCNTTLIHASRRGSAVFPSQCLDPPGPRVVQMSCDSFGWCAAALREPRCPRVRLAGDG